MGRIWEARPRISLPRQVRGLVQDPSEPHFRARDFMNYLLGSLNAEPKALGVLPRVLISYVSQQARVAVEWDLVPAPVQFLRDPVLRAETPGSPGFSLTRGPIGAPAATAVLEELACLGAREIWFLGYAGSLRQEWPIGTVVGLDGAWSDEGTSRHYGREGLGYADPGLLEVLRRSHPGLAIGRGWTTDAIYRETPEKIRAFQERGASMVDMEASAFFHVGAALGLHVAGLMVISDELYHPWIPGFRDPRLVSGVKEAYELLYQVLTRQEDGPQVFGAAGESGR